MKEKVWHCPTVALSLQYIMKTDEFTDIVLAIRALVQFHCFLTYKFSVPAEIPANFLVFRKKMEVFLRFTGLFLLYTGELY